LLVYGGKRLGSVRIRDWQYLPMVKGRDLVAG
jgi:hypothetical protein